MNSPGSWGEGGTLRVSSRLPRAPGGRGCRAGGKHPPLPAPNPSFFVMHFLRPRIPFVLKFKKIRPPRAASRAGGAGQRRGFLSGRRGAADPEVRRLARGLPPSCTPHRPTRPLPPSPQSFRPGPAVLCGNRAHVGGVPHAARRDYCGRLSGLSLGQSGERKQREPLLLFGRCIAS